MNSGTHASVMGNRKNKAVVETVAQIVFTICAFFAVLAVVSITLYMIISGTPAIMKVGLGEILFGTEWLPTAAAPKVGILWVILTSIVGTTLAILLGVPIGVLTAVIRDGQKLPVTDQRYRLYVHLWCDLFYLRAAVLWCRDLPGRIKRKLCQ